MKKASPKRRTGMRSEYDFSGGVRGKHAKRFAAASNVVVLDPDVAAVFPDSEAVSSALRAFAKVVRARGKKRGAR